MKKVQTIILGVIFYIFNQSQMEGISVNGLKLANQAPNLCDGWKALKFSKCVWQKSPWRKWWMDFGCMCMDSTGLRPWGVLSFLKQSDTQVPLLLLVKAHHSLNVHTTLSGPSASVSGKIYVFINLPIYLFSFLSSPRSPSLLVL